MASNSTETETKVKLGLLKSNMIIDEVLSGFQNCKLRERYKMDSVIKWNKIEILFVYIKFIIYYIYLEYQHTYLKQQHPQQA